MRHSLWPSEKGLWGRGGELAHWKGKNPHRGGGGVGGHIGISFTSKGHEDFVDMLMGGVSRSVGAGAGDQMAAVGPQYHSVFMVSHAG